MAHLQWVNFMIHKFNHNKAAKNCTYFVGLLQGLNGLIFKKHLEERLQVVSFMCPMCIY